MKSHRVNKMPSQLTDLVEVVEDRPKYNEYYTEECTKAVRELLVKLIDKRFNESVRRTDDPAQLTNAAYAYLQAHQSGYRQALAELKDLINR